MLFALLLSAQIIDITDGDTLTALVENRQIKVRLVEIDAPEKKQSFGQASKQSLSDLCFSKTAQIDVKGLDKYQRTLGRVYCDGTDANLEQVRKGMAWAYRRYLTDPAISQAEAAAKADRLGLWSELAPVPPWNWRHQKKLR